MILYLYETNEEDFLDWLKVNAAKYGLVLDSPEITFGGGDNYREVDSDFTEDISTFHCVYLSGIDPNKYYHSESEDYEFHIDSQIALMLTKVGCNLQITPQAKTARGKEILFSLLVGIGINWPNNREVISGIVSEKEKRQLFITENDEITRIKNIVKVANEMRKDKDHPSWEEIGKRLDIPTRTLRGYRKDPRFQ